MTTYDELQSVMTRALRGRRTELDADQGLRQVKLVARRIMEDGESRWTVQIERLSEDLPVKRGALGLHQQDATCTR